jgi:DNA-directed RNA polymerase, mitochondrial
MMNEELAVLLLKQAQVELEEESVGLGIDRYRKEVEKDEANTRPGKRLLIEMLTPMVAAVQEQQEAYAQGAPGRDAGVWKFMGQFSPEQLAFVTAKACINGISKTVAVQTVAGQIMSTLEATLNHDALKSENPRAYHKLQEKIAKCGNEGYRMVVLKRQMKFAGVMQIKWGVTEKHKAGLLLINLLESSTGAIQLSRLSQGKNDTPIVIMPTEATRKWLDKSHGFSELLMPVYQPMIVQPREWVAPEEGGYISSQMGLAVVKRGTTKAYMDELASWDMPIVYGTLNALQNTRWAVNTSVMRVLKEVWNAGGKLGKLPERDPIPLPTLRDFEQEGMDEADIKAYKKSRAKVYEENVKLESKRYTMFQLIDMAEKFSGYGHFHYVYTMDWRGRVYPVSSYLNPQGNDVAKALLQFAEGKALGDEGVAWLAVHGANCFGVDKVSFDERIQWVEENQAAIMDSALNPLDGARFWCEADSPYQFLAFAQEWAGYTMQGTSYVSHIAVGLDGSCNGLQNFSAMLRDEIGGAATNLVPSDKPSDIYSEVAKVAEGLVARDVAANVDHAALWVGKVSRKIAKRPSMTLSYGATQYGFGDQLRDTVKKINEDTRSNYLGVDGAVEFKACVYQAKVLYEAIGEVVVAAKLAMGWLQDVAKVVAGNGLPIRWETPAGLLVSQNYRKSIGERMAFRIAGESIKLTLTHEGSETDVRRNAAGISPNVIHSLDASHMMLTIDRCVKAGITEFAMVHDSYGTHACNAGHLGTHLREAFIQQYSGNVLEDFRNQILEQLPEAMHEKVPQVPPMGNLDLDAVRESDYFFA